MTGGGFDGDMVSKATQKECDHKSTDQPASESLSSHSTVRILVLHPEEERGVEDCKVRADEGECQEVFRGGSTDECRV